MKHNIKHLTKHAGRVVSVQSPQILTVVGAVGVGVTAYLTGKAAFKLGKDMFVQEAATDEPADIKQLAIGSWREFLPAIAVGTGTVGCIVAANRIQARRLAAMAAAYAVISGDFDDYKNKALDKLGVKKAKEIDDEVAKEKILANPPPSGVTHTLESGKSWFQDLSTGQNFIADRQHVEKARNDLNYYLMNEGYADLNEWYALLGLESTNVGGQLGWQAEERVEVIFSAVLLPDGSAATAVKLHPEPKPDFDSLH